jgi:hypothetical protein
MIAQRFRRWDMLDTVATSLGVLIVVNIPLLTLIVLGSYLRADIGDNPALILTVVIVYELRYLDPVMSLANIILGVFFLSDKPYNMDRLAIVTSFIGMIVSLVIWLALYLY